MIRNNKNAFSSLFNTILKIVHMQSQRTMDKGQKEVTYINRLKVVLAEKHLTNKWLADKLGKGQAPFRMVYQYNAYKYVKEFGEGMGRTRMGGEVHGIHKYFSV